MVLELPWAQKRMLWAFEKIIFQYFMSFSLTKLKPFLEKVRQSVQSYLNQHLVIGRFLENDFGATLRSKTSVVSVWKAHCSVFWRFLSDKFGTILWEVRENVQDYLNPIFVIGSLLENGFEATLSSKADALSVWKEHFYVFLKIFEWRRWNHSQKNWGKAFKTI